VIEDRDGDAAVFQVGPDHGRRPDERNSLARFEREEHREVKGRLQLAPLSHSPLAGAAARVFFDLGGEWS
jgi:hypothetical protein